MEKRIDELRSRTLKNRNKLSEIQAYLKKVKKGCEEMIVQLGKKIWIYFGKLMKIKI